LGIAIPVIVVWIGKHYRTLGELQHQVVIVFVLICQLLVQ